MSQIRSDLSAGGLLQDRKKVYSKKYDICLVEEIMPSIGGNQSGVPWTVVGTAFERDDGLIRAVFKPGISVTGSLEFRPVSPSSVEASNPNS